MPTGKHRDALSAAGLTGGEPAVRAVRHEGGSLEIVSGRFQLHRHLDGDRSLWGDSATRIEDHGALHGWGRYTRLIQIYGPDRGYGPEPAGLYMIAQKKS